MSRLRRVHHGADLAGAYRHITCRYELRIAAANADVLIEQLARMRGHVPVSVGGVDGDVNQVTGTGCGPLW